MLHQQTRYQTGITLIETMTTLAITSSLAVFAQYSFSNYTNNNHLRSGAEAVLQDMQWAKQLAMTNRQTVFVSFASSTGGISWCYAIHTNEDCDCQTPKSCQLQNATGHIRHMGAFGSVTITPHVTHQSFSFQVERGTVTAGHVTLLSPNGRQVRIVVSGYGRIRGCSPAGDAHLAGYATC